MPEREIPEFLPIRPFLPVKTEQEIQFVQNRGLVQVLLIEPVEPGTFVICPQVHIIVSGSGAHETDLGAVGAAAAIGATRHTGDDVLAQQFIFGQQGLDLADQGRKIALGFRKRQSAGRQGHAGDRIPPDGGRRFGMFDDPVFEQDLFDGGLIFFGDIGKDQSFPGLAVKRRVRLSCVLRYFQQGRFQRQLFIVQDPPIFR